MNLHLDLYQIELLLKLFKYDKCLATIKKKWEKEDKRILFQTSIIGKLKQLYLFKETITEDDNNYII